MKIRIRFSKHDEMKFIGHLDVMRYFQKCIRRAHVDIKYSTGFSPHQIMSFAQPLGLGITSDGEYMDIDVNSTDTSENMIKRINSVSIPAIQIHSYRLLPEKSKTGMAVIAAADYEIRFRYPDKIKFDIREVWTGFMSQEKIIITKETKSGVSDFDIKPFIFDNSLMEDCIFVRLSCGSVVNLKPETVMEALFRFVGEELGEFDLLLHRKNMYALSDEDGSFIALEDMGTVIDSPLVEE